MKDDLIQKAKDEIFSKDDVNIKDDLIQKAA
jgi:hypothetical protein